MQFDDSKRQLLPFSLSVECLSCNSRCQSNCSLVAIFPCLGYSTCLPPFATTSHRSTIPTSWLLCLPRLVRDLTFARFTPPGLLCSMATTRPCCYPHRPVRSHSQQLRPARACILCCRSNRLVLQQCSCLSQPTLNFAGVVTLAWRLPETHVAAPSTMTNYLPVAAPTTTFTRPDPTVRWRLNSLCHQPNSFPCLRRSNQLLNNYPQPGLLPLLWRMVPKIKIPQ
jgi:hypothetical protein